MDATQYITVDCWVMVLDVIVARSIEGAFQDFANQRGTSRLCPDFKAFRGVCRLFRGLSMTKRWNVVVAKCNRFKEVLAQMESKHSFCSRIPRPFGLPHIRYHYIAPTKDHLNAILGKGHIFSSIHCTTKTMDHGPSLFMLLRKLHYGVFFCFYMHFRASDHIQLCDSRKESFMKNMRLNWLTNPIRINIVYFQINDSRLSNHIPVVHDPRQLVTSRI